jgi:hypothetical protein
MRFSCFPGFVVLFFSMSSDHRIGATLGCATAVRRFGAPIGAAAAWKETARTRSIVRTPAHAELSVKLSRMAWRRSPIARAIEVEVDGTVRVAADILAKFVGLGHSRLRFAAIAGVAVGVRG